MRFENTHLEVLTRWTSGNLQLDVGLPIPLSCLAFGTTQISNSNFSSDDIELFDRR